MTVPSHLVFPDPPLPADLVGVANGQVPLSLLVALPRATPNRQDHLIYHGLLPLWVELDTAWRAAWGTPLHYTGGYRSYAAQVTLFTQRHQTSSVPGRKPKTWAGQQWWLKPGMANAVIPGTSNHGYGLAVDAATDPDNNTDTAAISFTGEQLAWLYANAGRFGFGWENPAEPWHLIPIVPLEPSEEDTMYTLYKPRGFQDVAIVGPGVPRRLSNPDTATELANLGKINGAVGADWGRAIITVSPALYTDLTGLSPQVPE